MKKAKFILVGISVLAVVGGALAFKTKSAFNHTYCVRTFTSGPGACVAQLTGKTASATIAYYTSTAISDCTQEQCVLATTQNPTVMLTPEF